MVTDKQVRKLFQFLLANRAIVRSARFTDMDEKTARKYRDLGITHFVLSDTPYLSEIKRQGDQLLPLLRD